MRIRRIQVQDLFGMFNHTVNMNLEDKITIIHGPNGFGKTALLKLVHALFDGEYSTLTKTQFRELGIVFDDNSELTVHKEQVASKEPKLMVKYAAPGRKLKGMVIADEPDSERLPFPAHYISELLPHLERIGYRLWLDRRTGNNLRIEDVLELYQDVLPPSFTWKRYRTKENEAWFVKVVDSVKIRFIAAQRLLTLNKTASRSVSEEPKMIDAVGLYAKQLAVEIKGKLAEYAALSQKLDRTFPGRVINLDHQSVLPIEQLRARLADLEAKRQRLMVAGILDEEAPLNVQRQDPGPVIGVLSVYVQDAEQKLGVFNDILYRIELFKRIIDSRFAYKELEVSKDKGFVLKSTYGSESGRELVPNSLSSGEQHLLVLLYELLFKVQPDSLLMIDEPELSLHVAWQVQFLSDVQEISNLINAEFLIATHSPQIVNDHWDLTVNLVGPQE